MQRQVNQTVLFTKPVHHLGLPLTPAQLAAEARTFFEEKGLRVVFEKKVRGAELAARDVIKDHYLMYSRAACITSAEELELSDKAQARFESTFGKSWSAEAGKVMGSPSLQQEKGISSHELYLLWREQYSSRRTCKLQSGVIVAWLADLDCYCINAFYPVMEENFCNPVTEMDYLVMEFDPGQVSWLQFRRSILGATNASKSDSGSFRGRLFSTYGDALKFPGRDNFVHGSAGPLEGLVERIVHEPDFEMAANPVGRHLLGRGIDLETFKRWKSGQSLLQLGRLFDATEEKDTADVLDLLDETRF
ncbi:MAG: hypothetical protein ABFR47_03825 [Verrucomicrobiota bacterium]